MTRMHSAEQVRIEQIRAIYRNTPPGTVTTFVTIFVLTAGLVYFDAAALPGATVFIAIMFVQTALRLYLYRAYAQRQAEQSDWRRWARWFTAGAFAGGVTIGVGSMALVANQQTEVQLLALLLMFAVTGGTVGAFGVYLPAFYTFFAALTVTPSIWLFTRADVLHVTIGFLVVMWIAAVAEQARRTSRQYMEFIQLRLENVDLVEDLRREKAAAEEANVAKSRFLASASHDLRQPVHALSVFVGALRAHQMDTPARTLVDHIESSVRALGGLFEGLLDISRLDAGVVDVERKTFAIQPLIDRVCRDYDATAKQKGLQLHARPTRAIVQSDPRHCERILRNIVANAVTYTRRGKILVGCRRSGDRLSVQVWDTGPGIAEHERERVFQEFYQVSNPERDRTRGVGLGLAIVKRLTLLLDHPLQLESWPGRGTRFSFDVPFAAAAAAMDLGTASLATIAPARGSGLILVIDDEGAIQTAMQSLLETWGYSVIVAGSYAEMLTRIAEHPGVPRLIICDYRLRDNETGSAAIEKLRNEYNEDIPGLLITGDTAPDRIREAQASGYLLLHKPVPNEQLRATIAELVRVGQRQTPAAADVV